MDLSLIIPAYNEAERLVSTLSSAIALLDSRSWSYEIIVVDDGSTDGMGALVDDFARRFPQVRPLHNESNRGKGFSIRVGVSQGSGEVVGFIDADDKTDLAALDGAMAHLRQGCDGIIGDRTLASSDIAIPRRRYRQWGSNLFRWLMRRSVGLGAFPDTQCGFKFFRAEVARDLFQRQQIDGYMFDVEILLLAARSGYEIKRLPVHWRDDPDSRFNPVSGGLRNARELMRIRRMHR